MAPDDISEGSVTCRGGRPATLFAKKMTAVVLTAQVLTALYPFSPIQSPGMEKGLHEGLNVLDKLFINLLDVPLEVWVCCHMPAYGVFLEIT